MATTARVFLAAVATAGVWGGGLAWAGERAPASAPGGVRVAGTRAAQARRYELAFSTYLGGSGDDMLRACCAAAGG